jgi:uncharacterized protein (TIGR02001 family)
MKAARFTLATLIALTALPSLAQTAAPAATPDYTLTGNLGIFSDYRFRGISQTNKKPAIQGGVDFAHSSGFYLGNWNSNVDSTQYTGANIEMDFYGGWKATFGEFGLDIGGIYYYYPGSGDTGTKIDNGEIYIGGSWGPFTAKYYYAVTDFFGADDSDGSWYITLGGTHDLGNGFGVNYSVGYQGLKGGARAAEIGGTFPGPDNIVDYKLGATYTIDGWAFGLAYIATNRDYAGYTDTGKNISNGTGVLSVTKSF